MPLGGGEAEPLDGLCIVLRNTLTIMKHEAQVVLSVCMPLCRCEAVQSQSLFIVLRNTNTATKHDAQVTLSACIPPHSCEVPPSRSLCIVLRNSLTGRKHNAQIALSACMPLCCCEAEQLHSLCIVLRNSHTLLVAPSNHKLPEAAARCSALPCKRKPFPYIFGNTSANDEAAAECALAVRAAHGRPSCSQLESSLRVIGHVWSAFNQHVGQERVRGRVLQQRRLPPALGRVDEALLLVHSLSLLKETTHQVLRYKKMAPRHNACRDLLRVPDAARASKAHQPEHKQLAQRGSGQQSAALLQTDVDAVHVPLLRVSLRRSATAEHDLPALHAASRRPAVQGMRSELGDELRASQMTSRVRFKPGHEGVPRMLPPPVLVFAKSSTTR